MRKSYLMLAAAALLSTTIISSCNKTDSADTLPTNYRIDGVSDMVITAPYYTTSQSLTVSYVGKTQEKVSLSLSGMPAGCGATLSATSGYPTFGSYLTVVDTDAIGGTYPIKLVCEGSVTGKKSYTFNLTVPEIPQCTDFLLGTHSAYNSCGSGGNYTEFITASGTKNRVVLNNLGNMGYQVYIDGNCSSGSYTIPSQSVSGVTVYGSASYSGSYFYVHYYISSSSGTTNCYEYIYL